MPSKLQRLIYKLERDTRDNLKRIKNAMKHSHFITCPKCKGANVAKKGFRNNLINRIKSQRFYCKDCDFKFSNYDIDWRMRNTKERIEEALELRARGLSLAQIAKKLGGVSRQSVLRWLQKFDKTVRGQ